MSDIQLEPYTLDHAPALVEAALESVVEVGPWLPWCHAGLALEDLRSWIATQIVGRADGTSYEFAIVGAEGRYLGGCGLNCVNAEHRFANLGYWVRTREAGRGVAPQAVREISSWAFAKTELERLEIVCAVGNRRSQRVAEKSGARREGVLRARLRGHGRQDDAVVYSIVRADRGLDLP